MQITDILASAQGGQVAANLAKTFGIDPATAEKAVGAVLPQLSSRIERNTLSRGGIADLIAMLGKPGVGKVLDDPAALGAPETEKLGIDVLDQVLWSKDRSRAVAAKAAKETGLSEDIIKKMLPTIAAMAAGGIAKGSSGALGEILSRLNGSPLPLPGEKPAAQRAPAPSQPAPPRPQSGGGDVRRQVPLPVPGDDIRAPRRGRQIEDQSPSQEEEDNPYGDLGDIIRRGGYQIPGGQGGGNSGGGTGGVSGDALGDLVRNILGGLLGFQNKGVMSWIINFLLIKVGWPILRRMIFGR